MVCQLMFRKDHFGSHIFNLVIMHKSLNRKLEPLIQRLTSAFKARSKTHLLLIFLIFALSGVLSVLASDVVLGALGLDINTTKPLIYWPTRLITLFIVYQGILLMVSACFGEFNHFSRYSLKLIRRIKMISGR